MTRIVNRVSPRVRLGIAAAGLVALGAAGGAGAVSMTRPTVEMAPAIPVAIARLPQADGIVTVKGRVAEVYGDRVVVQDGTGRALVDVGREGAGSLATGNAVTVQGRFDDGQLHASYLVDPRGKIEAVGRPPHGPRHGHDGPPPPPPPGGPGAPPPPAGAGAPPPPPADAAVPPPANATSARPAPAPTPASPQG